MIICEFFLLYVLRTEGGASNLRLRPSYINYFWNSLNITDAMAFMKAL